MKIKDHMSKDIISVSPSSSMMDIYRIFKEKGISGVPVVSKEKKVMGMVTKDELLTTLLPDYFNMIGDFLFIDDFGALEEELERLPEFNLFLAEDLMVTDVVTVKEDASLLKVPALMDKYNVNRLPVVDKESKLVGIITKMDLCRAYFNHNEKNGGPSV